MSTMAFYSLARNRTAMVPTSKPIPGTYDLVAAAETAHEITSFLPAYLASGQLDQTIIANDIGLSATNTLLSSLRTDTNTFFLNAYGLTDQDEFDIGNKLPLYAGLDFADLGYYVHPRYIVGTLGNDNNIVTHDSGGDDIIDGSKYSGDGHRQCRVGR